MGSKLTLRDAKADLRESIALVRLVPPAGQLRHLEPERQEVLANRLLALVDMHESTVCRKLKMPAEGTNGISYAELRSEVVQSLCNRCQFSERFPVRAITANYLTSQFRDARKKVWNRYSGFCSDQMPIEIPIENDNPIIQVSIDLLSVVPWTRDDLSVVSSIVYGSAVPDDCRSLFDNCRDTYVFSSGIGNSTARMDDNQSALKNYLCGMTQGELAKAGNFTIGTANMRLRSAANYLSSKLFTTEADRLQGAESIHEFNKTWHKATRQKMLAPKTSIPEDKFRQSKEQKDYTDWKRFYDRLVQNLTEAPFEHKIARLAMGQPFETLLTIAEELFPGNGRQRLREALHKIYRKMYFIILNRHQPHQDTGKGR